MNEQPQNQFQNNQANPTWVWQSIWADLFRQCIDQMRLTEYGQAYDTLLTLRTQLPPECEESTEVRTAYRKTEKIMHKAIYGGCTVQAMRYKKKQVKAEGPEALRSLMSTIKKSLYDKKWINKDFSIQPRVSSEGRVMVPQ